MKISILTLLLFFILINVCAAQTCLPEGVFFTSQAQIDSFSANFPNCTEIQGEIIIEEDNSGDITNLDGLASLTSTGSTLWIRNNSTLVDLSGLENIVSIGGFFEFNNNDAATDFSFFSNLNSIALGLYIENNDGLVSLNGLGNITSLNQFGMSITNNGALTNVDGIESLSSIDGNLWVFDNPSFSNLNGFSNLRSLNGHLRVSNNPVLISLTGLDSIDYTTITWIAITFSNQLSECEVQSICDFMSNNNEGLTIANNAAGCDSVAEVEAACSVVSTFENNVKNDEIILFPNPFNHELTIKSNDDLKAKEIEINIVDLIGNQLFSEVSEFRDRIKINTADFPRGVFVVTLRTKNEQYSIKVVKMTR